MIPHKAAAAVLSRAVRTVGDEKTLAAKLGISLVALRAYTTGVESCPEEVYLEAVDIVLDHLGKK